MAIITAANVVKMMSLGSTAKIDYFNSLVKYQALKEDEVFEVEILFNQFGSGIADVQFIIDAGYTVIKDVDRYCWIVKIAPKVDPAPEPKKVALDTSILPAASAVKLFPTLTERKLALFKSYVDQELSKMDLFPFRVYLQFSMWGKDETDIQFAVDAGYIVEKDESNECWNVTLPES